MINNIQLQKFFDRHNPVAISNSRMLCWHYFTSHLRSGPCQLCRYFIWHISSAVEFPKMPSASDAKSTSYPFSMQISSSGKQIYLAALASYKYPNLRNNLAADAIHHPTEKQFGCRRHPSSYCSVFIHNTWTPSPKSFSIIRRLSKLLLCCLTTWSKAWKYPQPGT